MKIYTNIKTLKQVKRIMNDMDLGGLLDGKEVNVKVGAVINKLLDDDKLVEFLQTITRDTETDFEEMESEKIGDLIGNFFLGIGKFCPSFLRDRIKSQLNLQMSS